jgi:hypothetical protein
MVWMWVVRFMVLSVLSGFGVDAPRLKEVIKGAGYVGVNPLRVALAFLLRGGELA